MNAQIRIPRSIYEAARDDLRRDHRFAAERVGFLFGRRGAGSNGEELIILSSFNGVADDHYVDDPYVGARIGPNAIHGALQHALANGVGAFHVHVHEHRGTPWFSPTDLRDVEEFVRPFRSLVPSQPHGFLVLSLDRGAALVWLPGAAERLAVRSISVVGFPTTTLGRGDA